MRIKNKYDRKFNQKGKEEVSNRISESENEISRKKGEHEISIAIKMKLGSDISQGVENYNLEEHNLSGDMKTKRRQNYNKNMRKKVIMNYFLEKNE